MRYFDWDQHDRLCCGVAASDGEVQEPGHHGGRHGQEGGHARPQGNVEFRISFLIHNTGLTAVLRTRDKYSGSCFLFLAGSWTLAEKDLGQFTKNLSIFIPKYCCKLSENMDMAPDPDPQHWLPDPGYKQKSSVADPDPPDPHVFGPPGSGSFYHQAKIVRKTLIPTALWLLFHFLSLKMMYMYFFLN